METGADFAVMELFRFIHDSRRLNNLEDPHHSVRAAEYAEKLRFEIFFILTHCCPVNFHMSFI